MAPKWRRREDQGAGVSLYGILGFVPLEEVLRLLHRSQRKGAVHVRGDATRGRIFFEPGGIVLATTADDESIAHKLVRARVVDREAVKRVASGQARLADVAEPPAVDAFLRELTVESLHQMGSHGSDFKVYAGETISYAAPSPFDFDQLVADMAARGGEWSDVERFIPDLGATLRFERHLGDRSEVTLGAEEWALLAELHSGATIGELSDRLGTTSFAVAKIAARLVEGSLLGMDGVEPKQEEDVDRGWESALQETEGPTDEGSADDAWWLAPEEPAGESVDELHAIFDGLPKAVVDGSGEAMPTLTRVSAATEVEEDTEAFLEKVFSELESARRSGANGDSPLAGGQTPQGRPG